VPAGGVSRPPLPDALVFDVDGTLAETEEAHRQAFNDAFADAGLDWRWDPPLYRRLLDVTGGKERVRHFTDARGGRPRLDDAAVRRLHARKTARYAELVATGRVGLRPGVARLLAEARAARVPLAIATTTSRPNVEALLAAALGPEAPGWFAVVAAGDAVPAKKPAPDVYLLALRELGLPPGRCVAFEDSRNGALAALAADLPTVVTVSAYTDHHAFPPGVLAVLDHLGEPEAPCRALAGRAPPGPCLDLATLAAWLGPAASTPA
jgi:HAD superfamily hydrolase (TIGR01509 family)